MTPSALGLHGFTSTPYSIRPLKEHLEASGHRAETPMLAGHGGTLRELARSRHHDWYASADQTLTSLVEARGGPVAVFGYSMGGLLAIKLALTRPRDVSALVIMAMPLQLRGWQTKGLRWVGAHAPQWLLRTPLFSWPKPRTLDISIGKVGRIDGSSSRIPIGTAVSLLALTEEVRARLGEVRHPTLLVYSQSDRVVPFGTSHEVKASLGSATLETLWLEKSGHAICFDVDRQRVHDTIVTFLARHSP